MKRKLYCLIMFLPICFALLGCSTGNDSIVFVTKTSVAVDVDTNPATFDVGYGRYEGSIAPVVKDGQVLPLLSSVSSDGGISSGVFGTGVSQNFGVGNAAVIMSQYLGVADNPAENSREKFSDIMKGPANVKGTVNTGRRYFFGTKTTLGFTTGFAAERGYSPDSISLGYKRKEFAYVPIRENGTANAKTLSIPSMLATAGTSTSAGINQSGFAVNQFYATGKAANYLAAHPVIRNAVISKIIGDQKVNDKLAEEAAKKVANDIDTLRIKAELVTLKASNLINRLPAADLNNALQSMKVAGIAGSTDVFSDTNGDGTTSAEEKRTKLKKLALPFDNKEMLAKIEKWVSDNN